MYLIIWNDDLYNNLPNRKSYILLTSLEILQTAEKSLLKTKFLSTWCCFSRIFHKTKLNYTVTLTYEFKNYSGISFCEFAGEMVRDDNKQVFALFVLHNYRQSFHIRSPNNFIKILNDTPYFKIPNFFSKITLFSQRADYVLSENCYWNQKFLDIGAGQLWKIKIVLI